MKENNVKLSIYFYKAFAKIEIHLFLLVRVATVTLKAVCIFFLYYFCYVALPNTR